MALKSRLVSDFYLASAHAYQILCLPDDKFAFESKWFLVTKSSNKGKKYFRTIFK